MLLNVKSKQFFQRPIIHRDRTVNFISDCGLSRLPFGFFHIIENGSCKQSSLWFIIRFREFSLRSFSFQFEWNREKVSLIELKFI